LISLPALTALDRTRQEHNSGCDCGFVLEESVREIRAEAANDGAEAASPGNRTRHAGLRRK